jgi:type VI secretion system protein ImpF
MQRALYRPYLLRRLTDSKPLQKEEQYSTAISMEDVRQDIYDNLSALFNSCSHLSAKELKYSEVVQSVLGFGLSDYSGRSMTNQDREKLRQEIIFQIKTFEPRIDPATLEVTILDKGEGYSSSMAFTVGGQVTIGTMSEELLFLSHFNVETGQAELETMGRST